MTPKLLPLFLVSSIRQRLVGAASAWQVPLIVPSKEL